MKRGKITFRADGYYLETDGILRNSRGVSLRRLIRDLTPSVAIGLQKQIPALSDAEAAEQARSLIESCAKEAQHAYESTSDTNPQGLT